jgi:hypothetical protein
MNCIICSNRMAYLFTKRFDVYDLGDVEYVRCIDCGFTASATHFNMTDQAWERLNLAFHNDSEVREDNPYNRNQRYFNQALMLHLLLRHDIVDSGRWLDWGSGSGALSAQLQRNFAIELRNFDRFMQPALFSLTQSQMVERDYSLVTSTAVFEHVRSRATLDEIESFVTRNGCLAVHTLVRGDIPADPNWMYLLPVHCAFHTNRSMDLLMRQWGYTCSLYNEHAKLWVLFRSDPQQVAARVAALNGFLGWEYLHFKRGFMDYWP